MQSKSFQPQFVAANIHPKQQSLEQVHELVAAMLGRAGCGKCGRVAFLRVDFLSDPPPEFGKFNVTSFNEQGLAG